MPSWEAVEITEISGKFTRLPENLRLGFGGVPVAERHRVYRKIKAFYRKIPVGASGRRGAVNAPGVTENQRVYREITVGASGVMEARAGGRLRGIAG